MLVEDLGQFRDDETELVVAEELPECQSLKGAVHQLLNALQRRLLVDLGFSCGTTAQRHSVTANRFSSPSPTHSDTF